jgi:hypothetical protein
MKLIDSNYLKRTKLLDEATTSIQRRMNMFKTMHKADIFEPNFEVDYFVAGKSWVRVFDADALYAVYKVGAYRVSESSPSLEFTVHFDNVANRIVKILAEVEE